MPRFSDGTEAKVGDLIRGKPYNTEHEVVGVVTGITPGTEACNLRVAFARAAKAHDSTVLAIDDSSPGAAKGAIVPVAVVTDYGETKAFTLVHRRGA